MNTQRTHPRNAGFTLLEVMAALTILAIVGWVSVEALSITSRASFTTVHTSELDQRTHRVLARVMRELQEAQMESLVPDPVEPLGTSTLSYRCAEVSAANTIVWGEYRRLELVPSPTDPLDGIDNDSDGLTDEHELRLVRNVGLPTEYTTVLVRNVAALLEGEESNAKDDNDNELLDEPGFSIERTDKVLEIRLSLQGLDPNQTLTTHTAETTVWPRN